MSAADNAVGAPNSGSLKPLFGRFAPTSDSRSITPLQGHPVIRAPGELRLHSALDELSSTNATSEFNDALQLPTPSLTEPILITTNGTILAGTGRWRLAILNGTHKLNCIEYPLTEDQSLQFILTYHQTRRGWNAFIRICLALKLKKYFQERALDNMRAGGRHKGSANLPEAQHIDVRQEIANTANVCPRYVSYVGQILQNSHPRMIGALQEGTVSINWALQFCKLPKAKQLEEVIRYSEERATNKVIRQCIPQPKEKLAKLDVAAVLEALQHQEARQPGSVAVRVGRHKRTVVLIGEDLSGGQHSQRELKLP
jgi:hypothetical protein